MGSSPSGEKAYTIVSELLLYMSMPLAIPSVSIQRVHLVASTVSNGPVSEQCSKASFPQSLEDSSQQSKETRKKECT